MTSPEHEQMGLTPADRFAYAFRQRVTAIDEDALALLVGSCVAAYISAKRAGKTNDVTRLVEDMRRILAAAEAVYAICTPGIEEALLTTPVGRMMVWQATQELERGGQS